MTPTGDETTILHGHLSHMSRMKIELTAGQRQNLYVSVVSRPEV